MRSAVCVFHPDMKHSVVNSALVEEMKKNAAQHVHDELIIRNMYELYPDFQIDVQAEHSLLESVDRVILQFPVYWYSSPALLKQWFDYVFNHGWAYGDHYALKDKEFLIYASFGGKIENSSAREFLAPMEASIKYIQATFLEPQIFTGVSYMDSVELEEKMKDSAHRIFR